MLKPSIRFSPAVSSTTFSRNFCITSSRSFRSRFSAAVPASCTIGGVHDSVVLIILPIASATSARRDGEAEPPAAHAVRLAERVGGDALRQHAGLAQQRVVRALPDHVAVRLVAEDRDVAAAHEVGDRRCRSSSVVTPPVGLCGELRKIARGAGSSLRNRSISATSGRNSFDCCSGVSTARAPRRSMFGMYVGKYGLKTSTPSPGLRNASQKNCSKTFAPGPATMFSASAGMPNSARHELRRRLPELGNPGRRAIVRLVVLDRVDAAGPRRRGAVERAVADLELDDVLALGLERLATASTVNAVSTVRDRAKSLSCADTAAPSSVRLGSKREDLGPGARLVVVTRPRATHPRRSRLRRTGAQHSTPPDRDERRARAADFGARREA